VPATLHTPLMSEANSIHGVVLAGAMVIVATVAATTHSIVGYVLAFVAVAFAAMNVVGGYVVTGRMLKMFKRRVATVPAAPAAPGAPEIGASSPAGADAKPSPNGKVPRTGDTV
jgi:NAD(P) transhydrogenase subunit alpha